MNDNLLLAELIKELPPNHKMVHVEVMKKDVGDPMMLSPAMRSAHRKLEAGILSLAEFDQICKSDKSYMEDEAATVVTKAFSQQGGISADKGPSSGLPRLGNMLDKAGRLFRSKGRSQQNDEDSPVDMDQLRHLLALDDAKLVTLTQNGACGIISKEDHALVALMELINSAGITETGLPSATRSAVQKVKRKELREMCDLARGSAVSETEDTLTQAQEEHGQSQKGVADFNKTKCQEPTRQELREMCKLARKR